MAYLPNRGDIVHLDFHDKASPAACAQAYLNGAVSIRLPHHDQWITAYSRDDEM